MIKTYKKDNLSINWEPEKCIHSTNCWKETIGLPEVFNPKLKPWINPEAAPADKIIEHIKKCPSGALSYSIANNDLDSVSSNSEAQVSTEEPILIHISPNGPLLVKGCITLVYSDGKKEEKETVTALCRCGASQNKPFCDGNHKKIGFEG